MGEQTEEHQENNVYISTPTTQLVSQITYSDGRTLSYEYDAEERITKVTDVCDGATTVTEYTYDALGQLLCEKVNGTVVNTMTYDNYGNITSKNGKTYVYDTVWNDLLTSYNGVSITYDAQGNPVSYLGNTLEWEKGRQLKKFGDYEFTYNANGIRTSKKSGTTTHTYILDGAKILKETWGSSTLIPLYDNEDAVCGIVYNNTPYYFIKNLQGDVIAITNSSAAVVAKYSYDAWGVPTIISDTSGIGIASINPFRYRSYYYDTETQLYYLQSRYYDPVVGRFINGDDIQAILSEGLGCVGYNVFTYCQNSPVNGSDIDGQAFIQVFAKIILGIILGIYSQLIIDVLDYLVKLISNRNAVFSAKPRDYILSILSSILAFFDIKKRGIRIVLGLAQILASYDFRKLNTQMIVNVFTDLMFLFVSEIVGGALNKSKTKKINNATRKISNNKGKFTKSMIKAKLKNKKIRIEQKFSALGVKITFSLNISNKIINNIANMFI